MPAAGNHSLLDLERPWYNVPLPVKSCSLKELATSTPTKEQLDAYYREAQETLDQEVNRLQNSDRSRWYMQQFQSRGTVSDKVASAAVKLSDYDFMFFMDGFNLLFDTARSDAHHFDIALKALTAVWPKLLPPRPLKKFVAQYFATLPTDEFERKRVLIYWYLEDFLKRTYGQFQSLCEGMLKDRVAHRRDAWLDACGKLLQTVAESRHVMMAMMVDKLGDPVSAVAHKAYHHVLAMLAESSTNQAALLTELEKLAFTKNCPIRPMRYCANIMAQFVFNKDERKLALKCVQAYLTLFRELVLSDRIEQSVTAAIITGIRRAFPYAGTDFTPLSAHLDALFVLANTASFSQRISALGLLQHLLTKGAPQSLLDRWYRTLYQCLLISPKQLPNATQLSGFFSMLYKALKSDKDAARVAAFVHRLLERSLFYPEAFVCAVLLLVGELIQSNEDVAKLIRSPSKAARSVYDPKHRDPRYCGANNAALWTLPLLARHTHPSVVKLAVLILYGAELAFDAHPLDDLTLGNFLQMFVDAKPATKATANTPVDTKGVSVFRRAVHVPQIPSASDAHFVAASPDQVDVNALFLHRYAVQRQRFLDGLHQTKSSWGEASGEVELAAMLINHDPLFGPNGTEGKRAKKGTAEKKTKVDDEDEAVVRQNSEEKDDSASGSGDEGNEFDAQPKDSDLEWGSEDDAAYQDFDISSDSDADEEGEVMSRKRSVRVADEDTQAFDEMIEGHRAAPSKKRAREEAWMEHRSAITRSGVTRPTRLRRGR